MNRHIVRLLKATSRLGFIHGLATYSDYLLHRAVAAKRWEIRSARVPGVPKPIWLRPGVSDWLVMERIFMDREYDSLSPSHDQRMQSLEKSILDKGKIPLIIDCGANIGLSSVWFAQCFPNSVILSLEPEPENFRVLGLNASNYPCITPIHAAISDRVSRVNLHNEDGAPWSWATSENDTGKVSAVDLPSLVASNPQYELMLVKVDIEGFEVNLFRSNTEWVDELPMMIFEMHDWRAPWSGSGNAFFSTLTRRKRDYLMQGENVFAYLHDAVPEADPGITASTSMSA